MPSLSCTVCDAPPGSAVPHNAPIATQRPHCHTTPIPMIVGPPLVGARSAPQRRPCPQCLPCRAMPRIAPQRRIVAPYPALPALPLQRPHQCQTMLAMPHNAGHLNLASNAASPVPRSMDLGRGAVQAWTTAGHRYQHHRLWPKSD